jgi:methyl-accepting chemotaxis protein
MNAFLRPGAALMGRLRFKGKFGVMALIVLLPIASMLVLLWIETQQDVLIANQEREGVAYAATLVKALRAVQGNAIAFATNADKAAAAKAAQEVDETLAAAIAVNAPLGAALNTTERMQNIVDHWQAIKRKAATMSDRATLAEHSALSDEILDHLYYVAERSRLLLDPEARSAYVQDVSVNRLPRFIAGAGLAFALLRSSPTAQSPGQLAMSYQAAMTNQLAAARGLYSAFGAVDAAQQDKELAETRGAFDTAASAFLDPLSKIVAGQGAEDPAKAAAAALDTATSLNLASLAQLDRQIAARALADRARQGALLAGVGISIALLAYLMFAFWRACHDTLGDAMALAARIADGDLSHRISASTRDEIGELVASLDRMSERIAALVSGVKGSSDEVLNSAREVAQANSDLSARTERQASSLEEMSASTEELSATVAQSASKIMEAGRLVGDVSATVSESSASMGRAVQTMDGVAERSRRVADITSVIDGIAFQTNILALNAAVEAARVGEQGRGFAVVAGEIRSLAQRSATAAKEIKELITGTVESIGTGAELVKEAGTTIDRTVEEIARAVAIMKDVATMAREQSASIEQLGAVVMEMNGVTQQNAAFVQQTSVIADKQEDSARSLVSGVDGFRLPAVRKDLLALPA